MLLLFYTYRQTIIAYTTTRPKGLIDPYGERHDAPAQTLGKSEELFKHLSAGDLV